MLLCPFHSRFEPHCEKPSKDRYLVQALVYVGMDRVAAFQQGQCQASVEDFPFLGGIGALLVLLLLSVGLLPALVCSIPPESSAFPPGTGDFLADTAGLLFADLILSARAHCVRVVASGLPGSAVAVIVSTPVRGVPLLESAVIAAVVTVNTPV